MDGGCVFEFLGASALPPPPKTQIIRPPEPTLENDKYKIYLVEKYSIGKHEILGQYLVGEKLYDTIQSALDAAHDSESDEMLREHEVREEKKRKFWPAAKKIIEAAKMPPERAELLAGLGITFNGEQFCVGLYRYDSLADAEIYAKKQAPQQK
jgi:hypothetical protein